MKKIFTILIGNGLIATFSVVTCFLAVTSTNAAPLISARVTQIIQDVKLLPSNAAPRPAAVNDDVRQGTAVRTGQDSRTELTFTDKTLTRLGANSVFSFDSGAGIFNLGQGSVLMQVPPNGSSVKVKTAAVTAAITGGTAIFGSGPPVKFMVLEGTGTFYPNDHPDETMTLHGGEMVTFTADGHMNGPTTFNVKMVLETSDLIVPFDELANLPLIYDVISQQQGTGPQIAFTNQTQTFDTTDQAQNAISTLGPTPTPSKFGAPATISSPNPYVITSGTQIQTDPTITTNGVTDFGKIYRGPATDGPFSAYAFGSTSSFDTTSGFDNQVNSSGAVFKFQSLQLTGNPIVNTTNGETSLALIGVDGITSAGPGGTLTFAGIQGLLFATQNGAINLGSEISFSGTGDLNFYARGSGSNLTLASPISGFTNLRLYSGGTTQTNGNESATNFSAFSGGDFLAGLAAITATNIDIKSLANVNIDGATLTSEILNISGAGDVNIGQGKSSATLNAISISLSAQHDLNWSGQTSHETATNSDGNVTISAGHAINIISDLDIKRTNGGRTSGLNITLDAGADLTVGGNLSLSTDASNIQNGGDITVTSGGNTTIGGSFVLHTVGLAGTATGTGGNIVVHTGGNLLAGDLDFTVDNSNGGTIKNGGDITLMIGGSLSTQGLKLLVTNYADVFGVPGTTVGHIGTSGNISVTTGGNLATDFVDAFIDNRNGASIGSSATMSFNIGGALTTLHDASSFGTGESLSLLISNRFDTTAGGTIGSDATINLTAASVSAGGSLSDFISNRSGGSIGGSAIINFGVSGDLMAQGHALFEIANEDIFNTGAGGTINSNATINVSAANISTGDFSEFFINNRGFLDPITGTTTTPGGMIGGNAAINVNAGNISTGPGNEFFLRIANQRGTIGSDATINVSAANISIGGFLTSFINTNGGGLIQGNAINTVNVSGNLTAHDGIDLEIDDTIFGGNAGGHIGGNAIVTLNAQNITTSSTNSGIPGTDRMAIEASIYSNASGTVGGSAIVNVSALQNISAPGSVLFWVANGNYHELGGGKIGGDAQVNVSAASISTGDLFFQILNYGGASIGANGTLNMNANTLSVNGSLNALLDNTGGSIGGSANVNFNLAGNLTTQSDANFLIDNSNGGMIGGGATINVSATSITAGSLLAQIDNSNGGMIGTNATINFNISGNVTVANDVTLETLGSSETTPAAAININGGTYDIGGTFLASIAGDGMIALNNANIRADTIKITAFGANGTLNIGGGTISADTMLKLYAAGSNGSINFVANVTLNSQSTATLIQAVSVTIFNGVIVTIAGPAPAEVFTDHPNYSSTDTSGNPTGGNNSTTGKFAGSGAHTSPFSGPTPTPSGTPSKFGPPTTIASPVPYVVTSNTVIQTDPAITTNGVTDYGKIWRGPATDGPLSAFIFGSTSSFDTASGFDTVVGGKGSGAGFKFTALQLTGDPTVSTTNGEINLALIAVNGITSGAPGGALTFAGIRGLLLATQNGPITLGPEISFSGLHDINIYARGSSSDLTLGSDISTSRRVFLLAERDMSVTSNITTEELSAIAGHDIAINAFNAVTISLSATNNLNWSGGTFSATATNSDGDVDIFAGNAISISGGLEIDRTFGGQSSGLNVSLNAAASDFTVGNGLVINVNNSVPGNLTFGANITLNAGGNLNVNGSGGVSLTVNNSHGGQIGTGGNISVTTGGGISTPGAFNLAVENYDETANPAGHIVNGGNISVTTGGSLAADSISAYIQNRGGGKIDSAASLTLNITGALTTLHNGLDALGLPGSLSLAIASRYDNQFGNTAGSSIGGAATLTLQADSASIGGILNVIISDRGTIGGNALLNFSVTHDVAIQGDATWEILTSDGPPNDVGAPFGGAIHGNATLQLSANNLSANSVNFGIENRNGGVTGPGGMIDSSASLTFNLSGNLSTRTDAIFTIRNQYAGGGPGGIGGTGGTIGQDAVLNLTANSLSIGGGFETSIRNARNAGDNGGKIGGNATIDVNVTGGIAAVTDYQFLNNQGGTIGSDAKITLSAGSLSTSGTAADAFLVQLVNSGGSIGNGSKSGGGATIDFALSGALTTASDATFTIDNSNGGSIGSDATITLSGANLSSQAGGLFAQISNQSGGSIGGSANINFNLTGDLTTQGDANFSISNRFGGNIGSNAMINVSAANISIGGSLSFSNLNDAGDPTVGGTIGKDATINVNAGSISATGGLTADIANGLGIIGGNAIINFGVSGDITTRGSAGFQIRNDSSGGSGGTIGSEAMINVSAVNISTGGHLQMLLGNNLPNGSLGGAGLSLQASGTITTGDFLEAFIFNNGGHIGTGGDITVHVAGDMNVGTSAFFGISNVGGTIASNPVVDIRANNILTGGFLEAYIDNTNGKIGPEGNGGSVTLHADGTITVGAALDVWGAVTAGGDINAQTISSTNVTSFGNINAGSGGIREFQFPSGVFATGIPHTLTAQLVRSQGGINFNGIPSDNNTLPGTNGGQLTINATSLFVDNLEGDIKGPVTFNGGNGGVNPSNQFLDAGSGGIFNVNTPGRILVNTDIEATSGYINPSAPPSGNGGAVSLNSQSDFVSVNSRIQVSSADPTPVPSATPTPRRVSAKGGNINITSGKTTGVAINIGSSAQLLSLLDAAAPGPGGSIKIVATKAGSNGTNSSSININNANGAIVADRGTVEIRHDGDNGAININNADIRADVVKVGALGLNGTLNIGGGNISADTILKLYATGSNGQLNFISNVTLSSGTAMHLAANTITIQPSIIVTISGAGGPANVYTSHPNYSGFGGITPTNGTFAGNGANSPQPLANAPGF